MNQPRDLATLLLIVGCAVGGALLGQVVGVTLLDGPGWVVAVAAGLGGALGAYLNGRRGSV